MMRSSYSGRDVTILLKDVTGLLEPLPTGERERRIQGGTHYSEMLPLEYAPTPRYLELYSEALTAHSGATAAAVKRVAEKALARRGEGLVLVSLARAGTPVGILMKRYLEKVHGLRIPHYSISIIRGRGIDGNAVRYILDRHPAESIQFVDGWTGKGAILKILREAVAPYPGMDAELAVLADPAGLTTLYGTTEDFLIPSACLNATVSGLFSRTILNDRVIGPEDFHGAVYFGELVGQDVSNEFLNRITACFDNTAIPELEPPAGVGGTGEVEEIAGHFRISDLNHIKPGIGETTRVLLRRVPRCILLRDREDERYVGHIKRLCAERRVEIMEYPLKNYRACGIIKDLHGDI